MTVSNLIKELQEYPQNFDVRMEIRHVNDLQCKTYYADLDKVDVSKQTKCVVLIAD